MDLFNFIKSNVSILDLIQEYATLKKAGLYWKGRCPFHHEKTASFTVSPHREIFYCFGCHVGGDVISFVAKIENCSQKEAAQHLLERYQLTLPPSIQAFEPGTDTSKSFKQHEQYNAICKQVALWCHAQLRHYPSAFSYIQKRGISEKSIAAFTLGYFPGGLQSVKQLLQHMRTHNFLPHDLIEAQIISEGKSVLYSGFEDRLIFPIKDHLGRFCGFGGRVFKEQEQRAKYYNSRENSFFNKGSLLFGLDLAKKAIQDTEQAFLVEGYTDCIAMVDHGYPNTVATLGTACTVEHLKQLSRYAQTLYVLYDGDSAGQQAIMRLTELCWQVSLELKVISLPAKDDPASFLLAGNTLQPLIEHAKEIFHFFIGSLAHDFAQKPLQEKVNLTRKCIEAINRLDDPLKQDILLHRAATAFDIPIETLKQELARQAFPCKDPQSSPLSLEPSQECTPEEPTQLLEKKIFCAIVNNVQLLTKDNEQYLLRHLAPPLGTILSQLKDSLNEQGAVDFVIFFEKLSENHKQYVSKLVLESEEKIDPETFQQLVLQLHQKRWRATVQKIKAKLANTLDPQEKAKIMQEFLALKEKMVQKNRENEGEQ
jgi:DNA primase